MTIEPLYRECQIIHVSTQNIGRAQDIDVAMSEAPSMTVCGQMQIDRTFVAIPDTENLFLLYNKYQEEWHLKNVEKGIYNGRSKEDDPVIVIPEENAAVHSRCLIVRKNDLGEIADLQEGDLEKVKKYLVHMGNKKDTKGNIM